MTIGKLSSSSLLRCCLFSNFVQFVVLDNLSILDLALSEVKGLEAHRVYIPRLSSLGNFVHYDGP